MAASAAPEQKMGAIWTGVQTLMVSQLSTRLLTFFLNLGIARLLTPEQYGLLAVQFHLINTTILLLSREGFRRGCLVGMGTEGAKSESIHKFMPVAALVLPLGALCTIATSVLAIAVSKGNQNEMWQACVTLQGAAAFAELLGEPLYILAQGRLMFRLRMLSEAVAQTAKAVAILSLLFGFGGDSAALSLSAAQLVYGTTSTLVYTWAFRSELRGMASALLRLPWRDPACRAVLLLCGGFSLQAVEKLLLSEGSKLVTAAVESSYNQGVYGMVSNLGSLVVRLLFQPFEEGAFTAFVAAAEAVRSDKSPDRQESAHLAQILAAMTRAAALVGLVMAAFGPAYAYTVLRLIYGRRWADTETAPALGVYATYVALLAVNGITEAFTHAVGDARQLRMANVALLVTGVIHMGLSFGLCTVAGTRGLIAADSVGMVLRICYSLWGVPGASSVSWMPHPATLATMVAACVAGLASEAAVVAGHLEEGYLMRSAAHVAVGISLLAGVCLTMYRWEYSALKQAIQSTKKTI